MERLVYCVVVISDTRQELVESVTEGICHTDGCILVRTDPLTNTHTHSTQYTHKHSTQ